jgi:hypothetical protein
MPKLTLFLFHLLLRLPARLSKSSGALPRGVSLLGCDAQHDLAALVGRTGKHLVRDSSFF